MNIFLMNITLAVAWAAMTGQLTTDSLVTGFIFGYLVLFVARRSLGDQSYFIKMRQALGFLAFFARELVVANMRVAFEVVTPTHHMRPGVIAVPLDVRTDAQITLLANLITMTPGTLSLEVSRDRRVLYIHAMYVDDMEAVRNGIKNGFERRVMELVQ